jgi:organic hydroperoxide reductase OsmC/OhrA
MAEERVNTVSLKLKQGFEFLAAFEKLPDQAPLLLDEPAPLGESRGPNASALLGAAVGNCLAASLLFCLRRSRVDVADMDVTVNVRVVRSDAGQLRVGGIDVRIEPQLAPGGDTARFDRCKELFENFCIVTESVRNGIPVDVEVSSKATGAGTEV